MSKLMTVRQFATEIPVSEPGIRRLVRLGVLPALRFGRKILLDREAVMAAMRRQTSAATKQWHG